MGLSLSDEQVPRAVASARERLAENVAASYGLRPGSASRVREAFGKYRKGTSYEPDLEAYRVDPENDRADRLKQQLDDPKLTVTSEVSTVAHDGRRETVALNEAESRTYFTGTLSDRTALTRRKIHENRFGIARKAAEKLQARSVESAVQLSPHEQACLREYDALEDRRTRVTENGATHYHVLPRLRDGWLANAARATDAQRDPAAFREAYYGRHYQIGAGEPRDGDRDLWPSERQYGPNQYTVNVADVWDEQAKAARLWRSDPFCKQGIAIRTDFVLGRGVKIEARDPRVQGVIDEFTRRHKFKRRLKQWVTSLGVYGDLFVRIMRLGNGQVKAIKEPAPSIWEIWTDPDDATAPIAYVQRYTTRYQLYQPDAVHYVSREIPASDMLHAKINVEDEEIRGRGDSFANWGWHRRLMNFWDAQIQKEKAAAAYQFDAKVTGTKQQVEDFADNSIPDDPEPGGWIVHNELIEVQVVSSDKTSPAGNGSTAEGITNIIAAGYGFAKEYFGISGNRTRGGALVASEPSAKAFEARQDDIGQFLEELFEAVIGEAIRFRLLDGVTDFSFKIQFPAIIKADAVQRVDLLMVGRESGFVSAQTAGPVWAAEAEIEDYDFDDEQRLIAEEREKYGIELPAPTPLPQQSPFSGNVPIDAPATSANAARMGVSGPTPGVRKLLHRPRSQPGKPGEPPGTGNDAGAHPMAGVGAAAIRKADARAEAAKVIAAAEGILREAGVVVIYT